MLSRAFADDRFNADIEFYDLFFKRYALHSVLSDEERYADAFYYAFTNLTPAISEDELIVGNRDISLSDEIATEWEEKNRSIAHSYRDKVFCGQDSHIAIDYELILAHGINGIIEKINFYLKDCTSEKHDIINAVKNAWRPLSSIPRHIP